jgi:DNA-binding beta-propeller fold protein YncE
VLTVVVLEGNPGTPTLSPDGEYLYLLEQGKPDKKPEKNINGRLQVVSLETRAHETNLDVGSGPRGHAVARARRRAAVQEEGAARAPDRHPRG